MFGNRKTRQPSVLLPVGKDGGWAYHSVNSATFDDKERIFWKNQFWFRYPPWDSPEFTWQTTMSNSTCYSEPAHTCRPCSVTGAFKLPRWQKYPPSPGNLLRVCKSPETEGNVELTWDSFQAQPRWMADFTPLKLLLNSFFPLKPLSSK